MKNKMFSGWKDVFLFTLRQGISQRYKIVTMILALILFAGGFAISVIFAMNQKKDDNISPIERVYVVDESGIEGIDWNSQKSMDAEQFPKVSFEQTNADIKELGAGIKDGEKTSVITKVSKTKDNYVINVYIPYESEVTTDDGENLAKEIKDIVHEGLIGASAIDEDKITYVVSEIKTEFSNVGEDAKSDSYLLFKTVFPVVFMFGLYFMVIIYGQSMGQIVTIEKSSKLMESLLVMTRPYGLIFGKIIATAFIAIFQMMVWMIAAVAGFIIGDGFAKNSIYGGYENYILAMFKEIAADESLNAFSTEAIILTLISICLAFLFYCMLAGAISSFASKADELGSVMMFYNMFLVIGFMGSYMLPTFVGKEWIKVIVRIIPMSSAFLLPGEILLGTVNAWAGAAYLIILMLWILLTAILAGKIYRDQVFYKGQSLLERLPWAKKNKGDDDGNQGTNLHGNSSENQWTILHDEAGRPIEKSQKIGYFFLAISPIAIFFVIQILASLMLTNIITRVGLNGKDISLWEVKDYVDFYHGIEPTLNPLTVMVSHLLIITTFGIWMYLLSKSNGGKTLVGFDYFVKWKSAISIIGICILCGLCLVAFANGTVAIEAAVIPSIVEDYVEMANSAGFGTSPFAIFAAVCLAPVGEELLCRGVSLHFGRKAFGKFWYANILQALLFGILHMNWVQGIYAFFIGIVLGIIVERYKSLLPAMLVHFVVNFSASTWVPKLFGDVNMTLTTGIVLVLSGGIIVTLIMFMMQSVSIKRSNVIK